MRNKINNVARNFSLLLIFFASLTGFLQAQNITGKVKDSQGLGIPGVNVMIKGPAVIGTITDFDGNFQINVDDASDAVLVFSFIGYKQQEVALKGQTSLSIFLVEDTEMLEDVVVVGYGIQKKVSVTGSISTISTETIKQSPAPNLVGALAGKLPGLTTMQTSSQPGNEDYEIYLRGASTLNGQTNPLVLVDGVPRDNMTMIDPNEVASISILKDASATAVFGVRGANGVILITTRQGTSEKPELSVSAEFGRQDFTTDYSPIDSWRYATAYNEALVNDGKAPYYTDRQVQLYKDGTSPYYPNTNWMDILFKKFAPQQRYNVNLTGGTDRVKYFINLGLLNQGGMLKTESQDELGYDAEYKLHRYNFRSNLDIEVNHWIKAGIKLAGYIDQVNSPLYGDTRWAGQYNFLGHLMSIPSVVPGPFVTDQMVTDYDLVPGTLVSDGSESQYGEINYMGFARQDKSKLNSTFSLDFDLGMITEGLSTNVQVSFDTDNITTVDGKIGNGYQDGYNVYQYNLIAQKNADGTETDDISFTPANEFSNYKIATDKKYAFAYTLNAQWRVNYNRTFNTNHKVGLMGLAQRDNKEIKSGTSIELLPYNVLGFAARATYSYADRYLTEFNIGYNGSEQFAKGKRFGTFPAGSIGWVVINEPFMEGFKDSGKISHLKLRASYGKVGSDRLGKTRFLYLDNNEIIGGGINKNIGEGKRVNEKLIGNPDITWEIAYKQNYGVDLGLFNDVLSLNFDYFKEKRENILITRNSIPSVLGNFSSVIPKGNLGRVDNKGYEIEATFRKKFGSDWSVTAKGTYSYNKNKIIYMDELYKGDDYAYPYQAEGYSIGQKFGHLIDWNSPGKGYFLSDEEIAAYHTYDGVAPHVGDFVYKDLNDDGQITEKDKAPIGKPTIPRVNYSFLFNVSYKNFDVSGTFQGIGSSNVYYMNYGITPVVHTTNNYQELHTHAFTLDRFNNGEKITFPALSTNASSASLRSNDFFTADRSFLRLKNFEVGYTLPKHWLNSVGISRCRFYCNGQNLFTWTDLAFDQVDPEQKSSTSVLPLVRTVNIGANINF